MFTPTMFFTPTDDGVIAALDDDCQALLSWRWLRDHGEDDVSRDPATLQRRVDTFAIDATERGHVTMTDVGFEVRWPDGTVTAHTSAELRGVVADYCGTDWDALPWLRPRLSPDAVLWPDPMVTAPPEIDLDAFLADDATVARGVDELSRYGYLVLRGTPIDPAIDPDASRELAVSPARELAMSRARELAMSRARELAMSRAQAFANRVGYVRHTIFGGMWDLAPDLADHADTAYTSIYLGPHTDGTYSHDAPGLQFFLCVVPARSGGESLLVDAFAIADELARNEPDVFADLASIPVKARYVEPGVNLVAERPVIRSDYRGVIDQVSFNNYDRAPFVLPPALEERFYAAYGRFAQLANDPARRASVTLGSGDVLIFDNWRAMHGRNAFVGYRHYVGAYLNHEDLESARRVLSFAT